MADGPEKDAARKTLREEQSSPTRIFVGKSKEHDAKVTLYDSKGNPRINMVVDSTGTPRLDFLDQNGHVTYTLPGPRKTDVSPMR